MVVLLLSWRGSLKGYGEFDLFDSLAEGALCIAVQFDGERRQERRLHFRLVK